LSRLKLLGRRALPALLVALLAAGAATPAGASLTRPEVARLADDVRPALDPGRLADRLERGRLASRSDPAPAALSDEAHSAPVVGPVLAGVLIPLDELALPPALDLRRVPPDLVVGLCRRDVAAVSGSGSSETRLRGKIEPDAAQPQAISIFSCVLAAGSSHTPYGEAHAETGPELLRARYDNDLVEASTADGTITQAVADETLAAPGGILLSWSLPLDETTLNTGLVVEQLQAGAGWTAVPAGELVIGHRPDDGISTGNDSSNLRVLLADGWQRGTSYRIRLTQELTDRLHRTYDQSQAQDLQWSIPVATDGQPLPAVQYDQRFPATYESYQAAAATAGGRFPAGQNRLFQGLWTDPVTGMAYARARWYDARNAHWLSEDPMGAVDSTNLYAFVGWRPNMNIDPLGLRRKEKPVQPGDKQALELQEDYHHAYELAMLSPSTAAKLKAIEDSEKFTLEIEYDPSYSGGLVYTPTAFDEEGRATSGVLKVGIDFPQEPGRSDWYPFGHDLGRKDEIEVYTVGHEEAGHAFASATDPEYNARKQEAAQAMERAGQHRAEVKAVLIQQIENSDMSKRAKRRKLKHIEQEVSRMLVDDPISKAQREIYRDTKLYVERDVADTAGKTAVLEYRQAQKDEQQP